MTQHSISSDRRYQLLVSGISDYAIYMLTPEGRVASWNAGAERFKGYTEAEIVGEHFSRFYTPEDAAVGLPDKALKTALEKGKFEAEGWRVRKDGSRFWTSVVIDPLYDGEKHVGFAKVTRDITERRSAQEALRESEARFRMLVQGVTDYALYMLSPSGTVSNWNLGAERIKGYQADEVLGSHFSRFYTDEDRAADLPNIALETARREGRFEREGWRVRKDGTRFWANVIIDAVYDDHGNLAGFAKITRDITEKKRAEEALAQANLALFQSQKMEAIGQLTGGIAHDFNNLLSVMSNGLELMQAGAPESERTRILDTMQRAVDRGASLTQQLLSFARQQPLTPSRVELNQVINGFMAVLKRAGNSTIAMDFLLEDGLHGALVDAARFEAALLNLVVNARDALPKGGKISIGTANVNLKDAEVVDLSAGPYVRIFVTDNGTGMPPEVLAKVFEPFFTTKGVGKGTGLGLSQVHGFMAQSGGAVKIESTVGEGTTVSLYFPAVVGEGAGESESTSEAEQVLIVDDEPDVLDLAASMLRNIGYEVVTANNGHDALKLLNGSARVGIMLSDVMMPGGISGLDVARKAREIRPDLKVLLMSGYPMPALKAQHAGIEQFQILNKPFKLAQLARMLRTG